MSTLDKAEYQVKLDQLKELVSDQDYDGALEVVQEIDWRRVKNIRTLCMVADVYEANDMLEDCRRILLLALKRASIGKSILSRLVEVSLMMSDTEGASEYYQEFIKAAPRDGARYLLQYKILKASQSSLDEQIEALHDYKECEYTEKWACELASLYDKAGRTEECIEECDDIILWFSEGKYVVKAMELKMKHTPLSPSQQEKYDHRFETMPELLEKEVPKFTKKKKKPAPVAPAELQETAEAAETVPVTEKAATEKHGERDIFTSTIDLQTRLSQGLKKVIGGMIHEDEDTPEDEEKAIEEEIYANVEEDRYAPQLEPEQPAESGIRRDQVMTKPGTMKQAEEALTGDTFDFSAMLEAQADAFATEEDSAEKTVQTEPEMQKLDMPEIKIAEPKVSEIELPEQEMPQPEQEMPQPEPEVDDFDLSKLLENEVADILNEKKEEQLRKEETAVAENIPEVEETLEVTEETPAEEAVVQPEEEPDFIFNLEQQIIDTAEAEVAAGREEQPEEKTASGDPIFDLEAQILKAAQSQEDEPQGSPAQTLDLQKQMAAERAAENAAGAPEIEPEVLMAEATKDKDTEEPAEGEFDLQALLAAEVSDMIANPVEPEPPVEESVPQEEPEDLVSFLEKEADRTIEHRELEKETPQDKRLRIMRAAPANRMTEEQKRVFTYFAKVPGMDTQILEALNQAYNGAVSKTSRHGNIAIMGRKGTGKTRLSEGLIKALCREFEMTAAKFARIHARDLNDKDVAQVVAKLSGGFLVIEKASLMTDETIMKLNQAMDFRTDSMILIIEDEKEDMKNMLEAHPEFAEKFDAVIKIPVFTNDELVTFARTYAGECGYKMDEMGILALYTIIGANQSVDEPVSIAKVKEMVDAAIAKASKGGRKIGRKLSGRQVDRMNRIILYEKDFEL